MHGLRTSGAFPGWTRLCDEWVIGLDRFAATLGHAPFSNPTDAEQSVADAAMRVRRFARGGDSVERVQPDANGMLRFELQGYDYVACVRFVPIDSVSTVTDACERALAEAFERARSCVRGEEVAAGVVVGALPRTPLDRDAAAALVANARALDTAALAWAVPQPGDPLSPGDLSSRPPTVLVARVLPPV